MPKQTTLDLRGDGLATLWKRLPEQCQREAVAVWSRLIAAAARRTSKSEKKRGEDR